MNEEEKLNNADDDVKEQAEETKKEIAIDEDEFKLTVRKLEMPVRPRGVLAE